MPDMRDDRLIILDLETTGLEPMLDVVLEVGVIIVDIESWSITDSHTEVIWDGERYDRRFAKIRQAESGTPDNYVREMHVKNGLWSEAQSNGKSIIDASQDMMGFLLDNSVNKCDPMVGSNINFDRSFTKEHLPGIDDLFHYRSIDVSSIKEMCRRFNPDVFAKLDGYTSKQEKHRVIEDCVDTMGELKFYIDNFLYVP